jgi:hypothetical protein
MESMRKGIAVFSLRDAFKEMKNGSKLMSKVEQKRNGRPRILYRGLFQSA